MSKTKLEKLEQLLKQEFSPNELKEIVGLSRRQIAEWDKKGILLSQERKKTDTWSWRKFSGVNIIQLGVLAELRQAGLSPDDLKELAYWLKDIEKSFIKEIQAGVKNNKKIILNTNLKNRFMLSVGNETNQGLIFGHKQITTDDKIVLRINIGRIIEDIIKFLNK
ncbi:MAG: MerR family transcriptional regulator [Candidatus Kuenenbacteria bacterium]